MDEEYVKVASTSAPDDFMEFPLESDGTLTLSTVQSHYPNALGLKYKAESGAWRALRAVDNIFDPPRTGWSDLVYFITESESQKRKLSENSDVAMKISRATINPLLQDMAVLGLPFSTTDEELKQYFEENCGELSYGEVKKDRQTQKSRGFGFIRFKTEDGAKNALNQEHSIGGRRLEVKQKKDNPMKVFVGRLPAGISKTELEDYFSQFGDITDAYVPNPFRGFGFVTYASSEVGQRVISCEHRLGGQILNLSKGEESKTFNRNRENRGGRDYGDRDRDRSRRDDDRRDHGRDSRRDNERGERSSRSDGQTLLDDALKKFVQEQVDPATDLKSKLFAYLQNQL